MGTVISRTASAEDILRDGKLAHENGVARGGRTQESVDLRLSGILLLITSVIADRRPLGEQILSLRAARDAAIARAEAVVSECYDLIWNRVGRPGVDPQLDVIFPGGASAYIDGPMDGFADRLSVLVELLHRGLHPRIPADLATEWATKIETERASVSATVAALIGPVARDSMLERVYYSLARSLQGALATVKRDLKSEGMGEAEIHEVIPDRPRATTKRPTVTEVSATPTPSATPATPPSA